MSIEQRIRKVEQCLGVNAGGEVDTLTDEEREELRTMLRTAVETGVPLSLPADGVAGQRRHIP